MKIGLDLDGVFYPFQAEYQKYLFNKGRITKAQSQEPPLSWNFHHAWDIDNKEFMEHFIEGVNKRIIFLGGDPYPGSIEPVQRILDLGHTIHIITDRTVGAPGVSFALTAEWVDLHMPKPITSITFTRDKTVVPTDMMIDDKPDNVRELLAVGCDAYLLNQGWNQEATDLDNHRVSSVSEFADRVADRTLVRL